MRSFPYLSLLAMNVTACGVEAPDEFGKQSTRLASTETSEPDADSSGTASLDGAPVVRAELGDPIPTNFGQRYAPMADVVAMTERVLAVASPLSDTALTIFERGTSGWGESARFSAAEIGFGIVPYLSVAVSDDIVVLGVPQQTVSRPADSMGAVHVYQRSGQGWFRSSTFAGPRAESAASFGLSLAIGQHLIAVGAPYVDKGGAVFTFTDRSGAWESEAEIRGSGSPQNLFGWAVAASGETLAIGSPGDGSAGKEGTGAVYVYGRTESGWRQAAFLKASDAPVRTFPPCHSMGCMALPRLTERFGHTLAIDRDTLVVGAPGGGSENRTTDTPYEPAGGTGTAYVFKLDGEASIVPTGQAAWVETTRLRSPDGSAYFGSTVSISGELFAVGTREMQVVREGRLEGTGNAAIWLFAPVSEVWSLIREVEVPVAPGGSDLRFSLAGADLALGGSGPQPADAFVSVLGL